MWYCYLQIGPFTFHIKTTPVLSIQQLYQDALISCYCAVFHGRNYLQHEQSIANIVKSYERSMHLVLWHSVPHTRADVAASRLITNNWYVVKELLSICLSGASASMTWWSEHKPQYNKHQYADVSNEIYAWPISQCRREAKQQKAHRHVLKWPHLTEPTQPVVSCWCQLIVTITAECSGHQAFSDEVRRNS